jgi:hypothetical protein
VNQQAAHQGDPHALLLLLLPLLLQIHLLPTQALPLLWRRLVSTCCCCCSVGQCHQKDLNPWGSGPSRPQPAGTVLQIYHNHQHQHY